MQNVDLHLTPDITVHVRHLRGRFVAGQGRQAPFLDEPRSYSVTIDTGEVTVDLDSLNAIMARSARPLERAACADLNRRRPAAATEGRRDESDQDAIRAEGHCERDAGWPNSYPP